MSEREEWMELIRNEYDQAPSHYRVGDDWDDGAGRIADAILADKALLLRKHAEEIERLHGVAQPSRVTGASNQVEEAACLIWAELCPGMVMGDDDLPHYEAAAKAVLALTSTENTAPISRPQRETP